MFWKRRLLGGQNNESASKDDLIFGYNIWTTREEAPVVTYDVKNGSVSGISQFGRVPGSLPGNPVSIGTAHCFDSVWAYSNKTINSVNLSSLVRADAGSDFAHAFLETDVKNFAFNSLTTIGDHSLYQFNKNNNVVVHIFMPSVETIGTYGMYQAFYNVEFDSGISFPALRTVDNYGLYQAFYRMTTDAYGMIFPVLETVGNYGMYQCFFGASTTDSGITFSNLTSIGTQGFNQAFSGCKNLHRVDFPSLTTSGVSITGTTASTNPLYRAFYQCTNIEYLHFPSSFSTYSSYLTNTVLFGGTSTSYCNANLQILFDL